MNHLKLGPFVMKAVIYKQRFFYTLGGGVEIAPEVSEVSRAATES